MTTKLRAFDVPGGAFESDKSDAFHKAAAQLHAARMLAIHQSAALLGIAGYSPDRIVHHGNDARIMSGDDLLAIIRTQWPALGSDDYVVRTSCWFVAPALAPSGL